jgi:hypothetical protein
MYWKSITATLSFLSVLLFAGPLAAQSVPQHFQFKDSTQSSYSIIIDDAPDCGLVTGDEIGIFDGDLCVGASVFQGIWPLPLTAWEDDTQTPEIDGYVCGNTMSFRVWHSSTDEEKPVDNVTYTAGDGKFCSGPLARCTLICECVDVEPPVLSCPMDTSVDCTGLIDPDHTGYPTVSDDCSLPESIKVDYTDDQNNNVITRTWEACDETGKCSSCAQIIMLVDSVPPAINCPPDIAIECDESTHPDNTGYATATDNCDPDPSVSYTDDQQGDTIIRTWTATDNTGNTSDSCTQTITIQDTQPPQAICPGDTVVPNDPDECGAIVEFTASVTDNCPGATFSCNPASGSFFPVGITTVTCIAEDASENSDTCKFTVTVEDTEQPIADCPGDTTILVLTEDTGAIVEFLASVADNCPGASVSCDPSSGSFFPIGSTTVVCIAEDASGNTDTCEFTVTVDSVEWECYPDLPDPELVILDCIENYIGSDGNPYTRYRMNVLNWSEFPDILFETAPDLPPCGLNDSASRTWIEIYDQDDNYIYGFCDLSLASQLNSIWFATPQGTPPPDTVYITLTDRRCDLIYTSNMTSTANAVLTLPEISCPSDTLAIFISEPGEVCIELPIIGADSVKAGDATWSNDTLCFMVPVSGTYPFNVIGINSCGNVSCLVTVDVTIEGDITPTNEWINVYCEAPTLNGFPLIPNDVIVAYDPDGVACGIDTVRQDGSFGYMPIYRDDIYTEVDEGADPGDTLSFRINDEQVFPESPVIWTTNGDAFELCVFTVERCKQIHLYEGWNLVSWNVAYSADMDVFLSNISNSDCVEVILSFDRGALTYDPDLVEFSTLLNIDYYHGYWFKMNCDASFEVCGLPIDVNEGILVSQGWNLVSYWPGDTLSVEEGFTSILENLLVVLGYDQSGLVWVPYDSVFNTLTELKPFFGYWTKLSSDDILIYPGFVPLGIPQNKHYTEVTTTKRNVVPSRNWISLYGSDITLDGTKLESNTLIEVYTVDGALCGSARYRNRILKFTPVYGYDRLDETTTNYPKEGETVSMYVNGERVYPDIVWSGHGNRIKISELYRDASAEILSERYQLQQNYPNPFNPNTVIEYSLGTRVFVTIEIFDLLGRKVTTLVQEEQEQGDYSIQWDGKDSNGKSVTTGVYLYRLRAGNFVEVKKMVLLK